MKTFRVSTITLVHAVTELRAEDAAQALERVKELPKSMWETGELFGEVDLSGECVEVREVDA